jgi:transposase
VHDTVDKTWRHLDFFQHKAFLHARVPRVRCGEHGVRLVAVPWARPGSGFSAKRRANDMTGTSWAFRLLLPNSPGV